MRVFIVGATGGTGSELVQQALERDYEVTAFVRSPEKITRSHERLTVIAGDPLNRDQLLRALPGHDVVLSAIGPHSRVAKSVHRDFGRSIVPAMEGAAVRRLLAVSTAFLFSDALLPTIVGHLFFSEVMRDSSEMEHSIGASNLEWTIVRPPGLNHGPRTGRYRVKDEHLPWFGFTISRADVAHFMLKEARTNRHVHKVVGISR